MKVGILKEIKVLEKESVWFPLALLPCLQTGTKLL